MFTENYSAENAIKKLSKLIFKVGIAWMVLSAIGAVITLSVLAEYLWWVSVAILVNGAITLALATITAIFFWGFAEIIANTKKSASVVPSQPKEEGFSLPEL